MKIKYMKLFLYKDISVIAELTNLKFEICLPETRTQGEVPQNFHLVPSSVFMKSRKNNFQTFTKGFPFLVKKCPLILIYSKLS